MLPGSTTQAGVCSVSAPDVCKTPAPPAGPVPVPYPNIGQLAQATNFALKVFFVQKPVVKLMSQIPLSTGDEGGTAGGVVSGLNMSTVTFKKGSSKVLIEGQPCVHQTSMTAQNGINANIIGTQTVPSQNKVFVMPG